MKFKIDIPIMILLALIVIIAAILTVSKVANSDDNVNYTINSDMLKACNLYIYNNTKAGIKKCCNIGYYNDDTPVQKCVIFQ